MTGGFNGSGTYNRYYNWTNDANNNIDIEASRMDTEDTGFASGLSNVICKDGQTTVTANLPMAGFKHTGVGNALARNQYLAAGQAQDSGILWGGTAGGSATVMTLTLTPAITAYAAGQEFAFLPFATSTGSATLNINGVGAVTIMKQTSAGPEAIGAGDLIAGNVYKVIYDGTQFQLVSKTGVRGPISLDGSSATISGADYESVHIATAGGITYTLPQSSTMGAGFVWTLQAEGLSGGGTAVSIAPHSGDRIMPIPTSATLNIAVPGTQTIEFITDGAGKWYPLFLNAAEANLSSPGYANFSVINQNVTTSPQSFIQQWGSVSVGAGATATATFSEAFPNACLSAVATAVDSSTSGNYRISVSSLSTSGMNVTNTSGDTLTIQYMAVGY